MTRLPDRRDYSDRSESFAEIVARQGSRAASAGELRRGEILGSSLPDVDLAGRGSSAPSSGERDRHRRLSGPPTNQTMPSDPTTASTISSSTSAFAVLRRRCR